MKLPYPKQHRSLNISFPYQDRVSVDPNEDSLIGLHDVHSAFALLTTKNLKIMLYGGRKKSAYAHPPREHVKKLYS